VKACEAVDALLTAHLLGALDGSEEALVEDHLVSCESCRAARRDTARCLEEVAAPPEAPPPQVWSAIRARIERGGGDDPVRDASEEAVIHLACSFCRGGLVRRNAVYCASCLAPHHSDCFNEYGRCSVMGCGEQRVVLPRALPPLAAPQPQAPRRARWPWLLVALASGGVLGTAAFGPFGEQTSTLAPLARSPHYRSAPGEPLFHVEVEAATLAELSRDLSARVGQRIELPPRAEHHLLVRRSWRGRTWREIAAAAGRGFGLDFEARQGTRPARFVATPIWSPGPTEPPLTVETEQTVLLGPKGRADPIWEGSGQKLETAPSGRGLAVLARGGAYLYLGDRQLASADGVPLAGAWSPDGTAFAVLLGARDRSRLVQFTLGKGRAKQRELGAFGLPTARSGPPPSLAWLEDGLLVSDGVTLSKLSFAGQATTFLEPSPRGARRFEVYGLGGQRFCIARRERLETWSAAPLTKLSECPLTSDYELHLGPGPGPLALVVTPREVQSVRLDGSASSTSPGALATRDPGGTPAAAISRCGRFAAWLSDGVAYVRPLAGEGSLPLLLPLRRREARLKGLAWGEGQRLAYWNGDSVFVSEASALKFESGVNAPPLSQFTDSGRVHDVRWCGKDLVVTTLQTRQRRPRVRIARVD
jgi:putative zinc finger protein